MSRRAAVDTDAGTKYKPTNADPDGHTERTQLLGVVSNIDVGRVQNEIRAQSPGLSPVIHEDDENIIIRRPVMYGSINSVSSDGAVSSRYRYYQHLDPQGNSNFIMPAHVVPEECYTVLPIEQSEAHTQGSLVTIFSIWNTMMGTSILSMPWALEKAGFALGLFLMIFMAGLALYSAYRVIRSKDSIPSGGNLEFSDICRYYLGRPGEYISICFSVLSLLGATVVYWILMSNFLYNSVLFIYQKVNNEFNSTTPLSINNTHSDVFCPHYPEEQNSSHHLFSPSGTFPNPDVLHRGGVTLSGTTEIFFRVWNQTNTVPFFLVIVLIPLVNFKSPTFFTKFNALGTICVLYVMIFILVKGILWGFHMDYNLGIPEALPTFPALTGILALAYFIHNCIVSIMRNQRNPENNGRDLSIAYVLVTVTYVFVGAFFYICFPLPKNCIEDNLLNNFVNSDVMAFTARIFLFFQIVTVFPLLMFILRIQILNVIFGSIYPGLKHVLGLNVIIIVICLIFATQLPKIGTIIRFSGALCGFVYVFTLPCLVYLLALRQRSSLTWPVILVHSVIIVLGLLNFVAQFLIFGEA